MAVQGLGPAPSCRCKSPARLAPHPPSAKVTRKLGLGLQTMRLIGWAVMLALVPGVTATLAQESPGVIPKSQQPAADAKPVPVRKVVHKLPAAPPKIAAPQTVAAKTSASEPAKDSSKIEIAPAPSAEIPATDRLRIQSALLWAGDYTGSIGGEDPMFSAIKNFQKRVKAKITGILTQGERTTLLAAARYHEDEFGWTIAMDPATGVRMGLPMKLVPQAREAAHGTRWSSAHGEVQVETFRIKNPDLKLAAFFEQQKKDPSTRKIEFSTLRDDSFLLGGMQGLKKFSVRAYARDGEIRGFTILFDQMMETIVAPATAAMVSAFSPFPERSSLFADMRKSVEYGNGLIVSARGHIITDRRLANGCQVIVAAGLGDADRVADDKDSGLALLRVYGLRDLAPLALPADAYKKGDVTLVGIPDPKEQSSAKTLTEIKARLADGNAIELRQPVPMAGFSGAAV